MSPISETTGPQKQNIPLWLTLGVVGVVLVAYFYVLPNTRAFNLVQDQLVSKQVELGNLEAKAIEVVEVSKQIDQKAELLKKLNMAIPVDPATDELLAQLEQLVNTSGTILRLIQPQVTTEASILKANIAVSGSYESVINLLGKLKQGAQPIEVTNLKMASSSRTDQISLVNATFSVTIPIINSTSTKTNE